MLFRSAVVPILGLQPGNRLLGVELGHLEILVRVLVASVIIAGVPAVGSCILVLMMEIVLDFLGGHLTGHKGNSSPLAKLNGLETWATDISCAYLEACT